jgi:hypothetical protein
VFKGALQHCTCFFLQDLYAYIYKRYAVWTRKCCAAARAIGIWKGHLQTVQKKHQYSCVVSHEFGVLGNDCE